ncbi:MAG: tetratricopeptide repeat protein [Gammaproteobacteria bacterium]|nr:tetratricopeptide repeat protein [Gammaproteobacteria bacterium]
MSLLMDALRKAEQDKKKAAKRLKESRQADTSTARDSGETPPTAAQTVAASESSSAHVEDDSFLSTSELRLEPIAERKKTEPEEQSEPATEQGGSDDVAMNLSATGDYLTIGSPPEEDLQSTGEHETLQDKPGLDDEFGGEGVDNPLDETYHGVILDNLDSEITSSFFEETIQGEPYVSEQAERSFEETLPGVPAAELVKDIGELSQPTPVAAQTVFAATATSRISVFKLPVFTGLSVLVVVAFSIFYYYSVTPGLFTRAVPSPLVARGIEHIVSPQAVIEIAPEVVSGTLIDDVSGTVTELIEEQSRPDKQLTDETGSNIDVPASIDDKLAIAASTEADDVRPAQGLPASIKLAPSLIKISRNKVPDDRGQLIGEAFLAYKAGDFTSARSKYGQVLESFPDNRDALLGLAAIALNGGDVEQAFVVYSRLLKNNPLDNLARAALINLRSGLDLISEESTIKLMIRDNPADAFLYFALGNIYAAQSRWAQAQQAFFDAYRYNSSNPAYALNLAVSLDQAGQPETALDYYNAALKLADEGSANFDIANVMVRIQTLSGQ